MRSASWIAWTIVMEANGSSPIDWEPGSLLKLLRAGNGPRPVDRARPPDGRPPSGTRGFHADAAAVQPKISLAENTI